jgi:hypothetical protein
MSKVVRSNGLYYVSATFMPGEVSVFDSDGNYSHSIGARGRGPGENLAAITLAVDGDTVFVYDEVLHRIQGYRADGSPTGLVIQRYGYTPIASAAGGGLLLVQKQQGRAEIQHVQGDSVTRSFHFANASTKAGHTNTTRLVDTGEGVWVASIMWYEFEHYAYDGTRLDRIAARQPHFPGGLSEKERADLDSIALIAGIQVDRRGRLLASYIVRDRTPPAERGTEGVDRADAATAATWKAVIDLIQPGTGRLVARYVEHDSRLGGFADLNHTFAIKELEDGTPIIEVFHISVVPANSNEVCE